MPINSKFTQRISRWLLSVSLLGYSSASMAFNIFACEPEYAALAQELAPNANIYSATTALQDPHYVQARPSLIAKLRKADLAICAGAELEIAWLPMLQMKANNPTVRDGQQGMFYAADVVEAIHQLDRVDRTMGDVHASGNPHFHFSPTRIEQIATALQQRLSALDPDNHQHYQQQHHQFVERWQQKAAQWQQMATSLRNTNVVAYHSNFAYLFDWLGINQVADLEPKPGLPPSSAHLAKLLAQVKRNPPMVILYNDYQDPRGAQWLAKHSGIPALKLPFTTGEAGSETLFELYDNVLQQLLAAQQTLEP